MTPKAILLTTALVTAIGSASGNIITRDYTDGGINGGTLTFSDDGQELTITIDNTTQAANVGGGSYLNSSVITGFVFDIEGKIDDFELVSFTTGPTSIDLTSTWDVDLNVNNNITPGNTVVDLSFTTTNGINSGIYNAADPGTDLNNVFPDVATLVLKVTDPLSGWSLSAIGNDILRMQRVGKNGNDSLKLTGSTGVPSSTGIITSSGSVPAPATLSLLGLGMVGSLFFYRRRRQEKDPA